MEVLRRDWGERFEDLFVTGGHACALARRIPGARSLTGTDPEELTEAIISSVPDGEVVFGFGNFVGTGEQLAAFWEERGVSDGI